MKWVEPLPYNYIWVSGIYVTEMKPYVDSVGYTVFEAGYYMDSKGWTDYRVIGEYNTLQKAQEACEAHARMARNI